MSKDRPFIVATRPEVKFEGTVVKSLCFDIINVPLTEVQIKEDIETTVRELEKFDPDCIVLTSSVGSEIAVRYTTPGFLRQIREIYCIGSKTAEPLIRMGLTVIIPEAKDSTGLSECIMENSTKTGKLAIFRSNRGSPELYESLSGRIDDVREYISYDLKRVPDSELLPLLNRASCKGIVVTSSLEAEALHDAIAGSTFSDPENRIKIFAIGSPTARRLKSFGYRIQDPIGNSDFSALIREIEKKFCDNSGEWI